MAAFSTSCTACGMRLIGGLARVTETTAGGSVYTFRLSVGCGGRAVVSRCWAIPAAGTAWQSAASSATRGRRSSAVMGVRGFNEPPRARQGTSVRALRHRPGRIAAREEERPSPPVAPRLDDVDLVGIQLEQQCDAQSQPASGGRGATQTEPYDTIPASQSAPRERYRTAGAIDERNRRSHVARGCRVRNVASQRRTQVVAERAYRQLHAAVGAPELDLREGGVQRMRGERDEQSDAGAHARRDSARPPSAPRSAPPRRTRR